MLTRFFLSFLTFPACDIPFSSGIFDLSLCKLAFLEIYSEQVLFLNLGYIVLKSSAINRLVLSMMINFVRLKNSVYISAARFGLHMWASHLKEPYLLIMATKCKFGAVSFCRGFGAGRLTLICFQYLVSRCLMCADFQG